MDKEVLIHVKGLQLIDSTDEQEPVEIVVPGEYYFRNGAITFVLRRFWRNLLRRL